MGKKKVMAFLGGFREGFQGFGHFIVGIINLVLLGLMFFLVIGPVSLISKSRKKRFLGLRLPDKRTYWVKRKVKNTLEDCYRQW